MIIEQKNKYFIFIINKFIIKFIIKFQKLKYFNEEFIYYYILPFLNQIVLV